MEFLRDVTIPVDGVAVAADIAVPGEARGCVVFAHGSGSSRYSPRNRYVAEALQRARLATVLADLLTVDEERVDVRTAQLRFDIGLLANRVVGLTDWLGAAGPVSGLPIGVFGASTGAAAALVAAAARPHAVRAVVSRGGRPDLAAGALRQVLQPTLLIVGGADDVVFALNRDARGLLAGPAELAVVPGATHLFEEPGALDQVCVLARNWFVQHLATAASLSS